MKKLIYGVGYNSKGKYRARVNKKQTLAYQTWMDMLRRCYCPKVQKKRPTYIGCSVCEEWLDFQCFAKWFYSHPYSGLGYQLDKDILSPSNKVYSPDTCCFVPSEINNLLTNSAGARGKYPQGVSYRKDINKICAVININGKSQRLGYFNTPNEAHQVYKKAKERYVKNKSLEWANRIEWDVFAALMDWKLEAD